MRNGSLRRTAALALCLLAAVSLAFALPLQSEDSQALSMDDVIVTLPGDTKFGSPIPLWLSAGESGTVVVYIANLSQDSLRLTATASSDTLDVSVSPEEAVVPPNDDAGSIAAVSITVKVDSYADTLDEYATVTIVLTDFVDGGSSRHLEIPVELQVHIESAFSDDAYNHFFGIVPNTLPMPFGSPWFAAIVTLLCTVGIVAALTAVIVTMLTRTAEKRKTADERRTINRKIESAAVIAGTVFGIGICLPILGADNGLIRTFSLVASVVYIIIGAYIVWTAYMFVVTFILKGIESRTRTSGFDSSLVPLFKMIGEIAIGVSGVAAVLALFGVDLNGILLSAGVVTLGITLGAQSTLSQFFSGLVLLLTRPFGHGDFVKINGEVYIVRRVRVMFTEFDNWDKDQVVTIPNNVVANGTIVNVTHESKDARTFVYVSVDYDADADLVKRLMLEAGMSHPHVIKDGSRPMPSVRLTDFKEAGMEFRLGVFVDDFDSSGSYAGQIRETIFRLFNENGVKLFHRKVDVSIEKPDGPGSEGAEHV